MPFISVKYTVHLELNIPSFHKLFTKDCFVRYELHMAVKIKEYGLLGCNAV
jgi:hypothetical protein